MGDCSRSPPILRLPSELHTHVLSLLSTEALKCCLSGIGPSRGQRCHTSNFHNASDDHDTETVTITDPAVLSLRSTNTYFLSLIPLSQKLLLQIERHPSTSTSWTSIGPLKACCVCLRLRQSSKFSISGPSELTHSPSRLVVQSLECGARYRFCRDCGLHAYPHPHPALPLRHQQRRRGKELTQLTTYQPGTKLVFPRDYRKPGWGYDVWVWCIECRLLKTSRASSGEIGCPIFCRECCTRLGCPVVDDDATNRARTLRYLHRGYAGIEGEIDAERQRRKHRLSVGAVFVAQGSSLLLRNVEHPVCDKGEEDEQESLEDPAWKNWFDLEGYATILPRPPSYQSVELPRKRMLPPPVQTVCTLFRPPCHNNPLAPLVFRNASRR
jgi:hypothetical protein